MTHCVSQPNNSVQYKLAEIWKRVLGIDEIGIHDSFCHLGGDSISAAQLVVEIQKTFGHELSMAALVGDATVATVAEVLRKPETSSIARSPCLVHLQPRGGNSPFFCVHPVGGEVCCFAELARQFHADQPFIAIRAAGSQGGSAPAPSIRELAAQYIEAIRSHQPEGPYYLGGYSFGGSVALEMAQQLVAADQEVALLAILDHTPPPVRFRSPIRRPSFLFDFLRNAPRWIRDDLFHYGIGKMLDRMRLRGRAIKKKISSLIRRTDSGSAPPEVDNLFDLTRIPDFFRIQLENHYRALGHYTPKVYPGRVVLFRARTRPLFRPLGRDLGWKKLAGGGLETIVVPGNHMTLLEKPHVSYLAERLSDCLREARSAEHKGDTLRSVYGKVG